MTLGEVLLWKALKNKALLGFDFDRQKPIDNYIVDFYCKELKLVIEIDGGSHTIESVAINDEKREIRLKELGLSILRFKEIEIRIDRKKVLREIENWVKGNCNIGPTPSPSNGGEKEKLW